MKMPSRPFHPVALPPDIFGLQVPGLLEDEAHRRSRIAAVEAGVALAFKAAVGHLGEDEARRLFAQVSRRTGRGKGRMLAADRDVRLLQEFDESALKGESIAALARRLHNTSGIELGNTEGAIETQIRKLVRERKKRDKAAAFEARRWRMATYRDPPGLLSIPDGEK